jgi:hypothetical protein
MSRALMTTIVAPALGCCADGHLHFQDATRMDSVLASMLDPAAPPDLTTSRASCMPTTTLNGVLRLAL